MPAALTWDRLRELASYRATRGCAISLYVNLHPSEVPTAGDIAARLTSLTDAAERHAPSQRSEPTAGERHALRSDLDRIASYFENEFDRRGVHGAAIFAAGLDNIFRPLLLSERVRDSVRVGRSFSLAPLVP